MRPTTTNHSRITLCLCSRHSNIITLSSAPGSLTKSSETRPTYSQPLRPTVFPPQSLSSTNATLSVRSASTSYLLSNPTNRTLSGPGHQTPSNTLLYNSSHTPPQPWPKLKPQSTSRNSSPSPSSASSLSAGTSTNLQEAPPHPAAAAVLALHATAPWTPPKSPKSAPCSRSSIAAA